MSVPAALLTALAAAAFTQPQIDPSQLRTVVMTPVAIADGLTQFERICLASGFDHDRFSAAVAGSPWRFSAERGVGTPTPDVRRASQAVVNFHGPPVQQQRAFAPGQCNMEFYARSATDRAAVLAELAAAVERVTGATPPRYEFRGETCWRWLAADGRVNRLCLMHWPAAQSNHFALSYQLWTIEGERRARLTPTAESAR